MREKQVLIREDRHFTKDLCLTRNVFRLSPIHYQPNSSWKKRLWGRIIETEEQIADYAKLQRNGARNALIS